MNHELERVSGITQLPIFPLPLVMLPGEQLPLHIFEPKYRQMLKDVTESNRFFGISYFEPAETTLDRPAIDTVGCVAEVREVEALADGRSNILTLGVVRYRLNEYVETDHPYIVGEVGFFQDEAEDPAEVDPLADEVFDVFERLARAAFKLGGSQGRFPEIDRTDPESLSFLVTAAFNFENEKKYRLLEMTSTTRRLTDLKHVLDQAVTQMEESADIHTVSRHNGHSKKKLDI